MKLAAIIAFTVYTIFFQALVWVGGMLVILERGWSPWWVLLLLLMSGAQFKPEHFLALAKE